MGVAQSALDAAREYMRRHPEEWGRAVRSALGLRIGVPLAAFRWLGAIAEREGKVRDMTIDAKPPGLRVSASLDLMRTPVRGSAVVYIDRVEFDEEQMKVTIRLEDVDLKLDGEAQTPVAMLIQSGALDLRKPGNLVNYLPNRPPIIIEAQDNRIVLDFMRDPKLANNELIRRAVAVAMAFVTLRGLETDGSHLDVRFGALPSGLRGPVEAIRRHVVLPSLGRLLRG